MQSSKILLKDGQTVDLVDSRIDDGYIETWNNKLNAEITSPNGTINVQSSTDIQTNTKTFDISVNTDIVATNKDVSDLEDKINYKLDSKEDVSNKIQVVNDSSTTEYPSSKAVANFVNSSVSTNTATFLGNFSLEDLGLTYPATEVQIASALNSHTWPTGYPTNNDYVYVEISNPQSSIYDKVQRYKYRGSVASWGYEYTLNNSSFTSEEMAAIDSGITSQDVTNLRVDHTTLESHVHNTSNPHSVTKAQVGLSKVDNTSDADKPVSTAQQNALNMKLGKTGDSSNTTSTFTKESGDTSSITSGSKLSAIFTAISSFFASLKSLAFKDKVTDSDISGTVSDSHIASASTWNGKYTKPSTGIPKTDLASSVQTSLGKADTALQKHQDISGKADIANESQTILSEPSQSYGSKYLIVSQTTFGEKESAFHNYDLSMIIQSRHSGTGLAVIQCNVNENTPTETGLTGTINIFTTNAGNRISSPLTMYRKYDSSAYKWTVTVVVRCSDYNNFKIKSILSKNGLNYSTSCSYVTDLSTLGTQIASAVTASNSNHKHTTAIAADSSSGTVVSLAHNTQYKLTAGGTTVLFKTPADNNSDTKVTQTADNTSAGTGFEVLFSATGDNTTRTEGSRKSNKLTFQPSTGTLTASKFSGPLTGNVTGNCSGSSGSCTGNAATATKAANADITRTADMTNGDKLQIGTGTAVNITNAKHAASADSANTATNYASGGGIANALNGKASTGHLHDDRYIKASSGNKSLSFGGTTTIGTVQGNNVNLVMPEADSDIYYVSANVTSFSDVLAAFNSKQKLILQIGFKVSDTATAAYNIPLNRIIFSDDIPSTFTWVYTQDRLQGDANRGAITTWSLGSSGWESHSEFTYYADTAGLSNKASALIDFGNTNKMTRVGWEGNSIGKVIATGNSTSLSESSYLAAYYVADDMGHVKDVKAANVQVGSAKSVNADAGESISSTGTNGSMEILNGALTSSSGGGGSCSIDGDGISFTKGVGGSSMTADSISTAGTGTFTGGVEAKGRSIDGSAKIVTNANITWASNTTNLVVNRSAASTTTVDLKNLLNGVVYWLHVPKDNTIALKNSSSLSTFYCYDSSFTTNKTTDTYNIRSHIRGGSHGGFSSAIVRSNNNFYVMMDY